MTDSMKFGPEWLRNMSADSTNFGHSIGGGNSSINNSSTLNNVSGSGSHQNNLNTITHMPAVRNMFPEFRYGREEMLSLFDKNCNIPEILPSYKKIFVGKVQCPLALTPSTDEEMLTQGQPIATQRSAWIQRSPVGFGSSTRGSGRGGSVERGRIRGKSVYHPIYQRPTAVFEDDMRSTLKPERGWSERNGTGDSLGSSVSGVNPGSDWNGTLAASPRKEFPTHSRNLENWRRNRHEDSSGGDAAGGGLTSTDGWRGPSVSSFGSTHRWARSTSWRDDDNSHGNADGSYGSNGVTMQRSYSTLSAGERGNFVSLSKSSQSSTRPLLSTGSSSPQSTRNNQWSNGSSNTEILVDGEDNLPEWAMENASNGGGTFDATGAFHGSVEDEVSFGEKKNQKHHKRRNSTSSNESIVLPNEGVKKRGKNTVDKDNDNCMFSKDPTLPSVADRNEMKDLEENKYDINIENDSSILELETLPQKFSKHLGDSEVEKLDCAAASEESSLETNIVSDVHSSYLDNNISNDSKAALTTTRDTSQNYFSDRMKEVADDMVEKLIMDDDTADTNGNNSLTCTDTNTIISSGTQSGLALQNSFVSPVVAAILKQPVGQNTTSVSPPIVTLPGSHKAIPLYGGGVVIDHATMQQHHLQQQQLAASPTTSSAALPHTMNSVASSDFWYYRDPQSKVQGPFTAVEMTEWYRAGYFNENLYVRRVSDTRFRALGDLIKICQGNMPFTHGHLMPMDLENITHGQIHDKPQAITNFGLKQNEQPKDLKGNVTVAPDSLSSAVKNLISSVDVSHMLTIHYQLLKDQYIQHQEMMMVAELSKNECFQRLPPPEKEALVRQKVQMLGLPEYLTSLTGFSNSLATLNPSGTHLYDAIAECSKNLFTGAQLQSNVINTFLDPEDFILNAHHQQQPSLPQYPNSSYGSVMGANTENNCGGKIVHSPDDLSESDVINEYNLRMFLRGGNLNAQLKTPDYIGATTTNDYITEQQLLAVATAQSPLMQMWIPQMGTTENTSQIIVQQQPQSQSNQWVDGPLVGIPSVVISGGQLKSGNIGQPKSIPTSVWESSSMENVPNETLQPNTVSFDDQQPQQVLEHLELKQQETQHNSQCNESNASIDLQSPISLVSDQNIDMEEIYKPQYSVPSIKERKDELTDKLQILNKQNNKTQTFTTKNKNDNGNNKKNEEERRREQADEKRRQKEERKRQQVDEEKRRMQQIEDEKRRQIQEEKERQQQIQAQRRKALLGTATSAAITATINSTAVSTLPASGSKVSKEQHRIQSSIAPWSTQPAVGSGSPCLAEIQKAERRERRADQQRQMETLEKIMRSNTAIAEANDTILKWNASPIPVRSFAEIQAEEAKRLASEHVEFQRRKELEQQVALTSSTSGGNTSTNGNMPPIWSGTKVWGSTSTAGFWEEPIKYSAAVTANTAGTTAAVVASSVGNVTAKNSQTTLTQKMPVQQGSVPSRNLKKSQTVSIMQNSGISAVKNTKSYNQPQQNSGHGLKQSIKVQQLKDTDKKINAKNPHNNLASVSNININKRDDLENEFTSWCTKSLNNMNTKVDVPTFVSFLQDLESPYEVKDYIRMYLGESKEFIDFAKQFLERRSKYKNLQRAQNAHNDDMCKPAPAITPSGNDSSDNKGKQKKIKKSKMTKLDARILGFSVTAAEGRINVGDRDYVDAP